VLVLEKIESYMLPCLNKKMFGLDCPGCGMQRALLHVSKGNFSDAFNLYPAIFTLILLFVFIGINFFYKFKHAYKIKVGLIVLNASIIVITYTTKMLT